MVTPYAGRGWITAGAVTGAGLVIILFWPTVLWVVRQWRNNDHCAHGPVIPLVSGVLLWRHGALPNRLGASSRKKPTQSDDEEAGRDPRF